MGKYIKNWLTDNQCCTSWESALDLECYNSFENECPDISITVNLDCCLF